MHDNTKPGGGITSASDVRRNVRLLHSRGGLDLFVFFVLAAADGHWQDFAVAFSEMADISEIGVEVLLERPEPSLGWTHVYNTASLPPSLLQLFMRLIALAREASNRTKSHTQRADILAALRSSPEATSASIPEALWKSLSIQ